MPSPVGHSLLGLAIGAGCLLPAAPLRELLRALNRRRGLLLGAVVLANLPDVDYLPGLFVGDWNAYHHGYTHTVPWILMAAVGVWLAWRFYRPGLGRGLLALLLALLASHLAADYLTDDGSPPYGILLAWPFSDARYIAPHPIFWQLRKADVADALQAYNLRVLAVEALWTLPLVVVALLGKLRLSSRRL